MLLSIIAGKSGLSISDGKLFHKSGIGDEFYRNSIINVRKTVHYLSK